MTHICVGKLTIIGSDNSLLPNRHQANIWTKARILLIGTLETNFSEILIKIHIFSFKKMYLKMSSGKWQPFCLGLNVFKLLSVPAAIPTYRATQFVTKAINCKCWDKNEADINSICLEKSSHFTTNSKCEINFGLCISNLLYYKNACLSTHSGLVKHIRCNKFIGQDNEICQWYQVITWFKMDLPYFPMHFQW